VRFVLDHDVDARVAGLLRSRGHQAWTASDANLYSASDDTLTVYADDRGATLLTHDDEFSKRRRRNVVGRHVQLRCPEPDAVALLTERLDELLPVLNSGPDVFVRLSFRGSMKPFFGWA
jgi:predicted nuclease of predicted toxin-antitoxin system